jgi:hypothetical protein
MEVGYEIMDLVSMAVGIWPFRKNEVKKGIKIPIIFHHLPGILLTIPVLQGGYQTNFYVQTIGTCLCLAGGVSYIAKASIYLLDMKKNLVVVTILTLANFTFFCVARLYIFPIAMMGFISDLKADLSTTQTMLNGTIGGGVLMMLFNTLILIPVVKKVIKQVKACISGDVSILLDKVDTKMN